MQCRLHFLNLKFNLHCSSHSFLPVAFLSCEAKSITFQLTEYLDQVGNSKNGDQQNIDVTSMSLHFCCSLL